jgi:hypothetical protein
MEEQVLAAGQVIESGLLRPPRSGDEFPLMRRQ